ncbi:MAG: ABC transporter permease subunit [Planctomycetaceae bacterium]|nr:ABC transporter permease subunit [Planctomycetaceae bacterium]
MLLAEKDPIGTLSRHEWSLIGGVSLAVLLGLIVVTYTTRMGIIARAATKEAVRQPVYLLLLFIATILLCLNTILPFFSLGDDLKMLKDCGLATILICSLLLAVWTASTGIADEIEGKTAMTLLSKPINRRQFILGKYVGIVNAILALMIPLSVLFLGLIAYKVGYDAHEAGQEKPEWAERGIETLQVIPGLLLIFLEAVVMAAISVAIATRLPMVVNMVTCFTIFVVGHLTPVLVQTVLQEMEYVKFTAQLVATILPSLEVFNINAAVATGSTVPGVYLGASLAYCAAYSAIAILLAFILFEDRDLA